MPKATNHDAVLRIIEMLRHIPAKSPGITARELHEILGEEYGIDKRTVERDLEKCEGPLGLVCNNIGKPYGWYWAQGRGLDLPTMSTSDALSVRIVEDLLRPLLPKAMLEALELRFVHARKALEELAASNPRARWLEKVCHVQPAQPLLPPKIDPDVLATIQEALLKDNQVEVLYQKHSAHEPNRFILHPLGLVQRGAVTYLLATASFEDKDYDDIRLYALHRILQATAKREKIHRPKEYSLERYVQEGHLQFGDGSTLKLEVLVTQKLADILAETPLAEDQRQVAMRDRFKVTATVLDTWQLRWWILSQGSDIEVLKPVELRNEIAATLTKATEQYGDKTMQQDAQ